MQESNRERLLAASIDVDEAMERFLNNEALLMKFLRRFPADASFSRLEEAMARGDTAQAFEAAHTLKGVAGNLSLKGLFEAVCPLVESLRAGELAAAQAQLGEAAAWHRRTVEAIEAIA